MELGEKILHMRAKLDMSQEKMAEELGVAFVTLNRWENGRANPTKKKLLQIEEYCRSKNISFDEV
ncbi:MAG: helix-turn-helix domain-containing protein [Methanomassiliicoccaceae archaeon]|nr:helix-turn-helix domain-containing protein [Methanomassiliicoccaceae archaeon]